MTTHKITGLHHLHLEEEPQQPSKKVMRRQHIYLDFLFILSNQVRVDLDFWRLHCRHFYELEVWITNEFTKQPEEWFFEIVVGLSGYVIVLENIWHETHLLVSSSFCGKLLTLLSPSYPVCRLYFHTKQLVYFRRREPNPYANWGRFCT